MGNEPDVFGAALAQGRVRNEGGKLRVMRDAPSPTRCEHMNFLSKARIGRLTEHEGGPVTGYTAEIRIECSDCGLPFRFLGMAAGSHYAEPRVSADALELRAPLEPAHVTEICGQPLVSGHG